MKTSVRILVGLALSAATTFLPVHRSQAATTVGVDPGAAWLGYMNVFDLPANGGAFQFGSGWGIPDLTASFSGATLTLGPNTIDDPGSYWYTPGGGPGAMGNKTMDANMYVETTGTLSGQDLTFTGLVLNNTLVSPYTSVAFIKDFAPDYSSFNTVTAPLVNGVFSITLATDADPTRHVQYGFETIGPNVWITDVAPYGTVQITAVPEPASFVLAGLGMIALLAVRRREK
jgi:PEP-CTERM motif